MYAVRSRADMQVVVGTRYLQFVKEDLRHVVIVVLSRMDDYFLYFVSIVVADGTAKCGGFDDLGTRPDDGDKFHGRFGFHKVISP